MSDFDRAFVIVLDIERGYSNDPLDPGGETNFGISKRSYPNEDIRFMTADRAREIYRRDYWDEIRGDDLPYPLNLFVFDAAVNQGKKQAVRMLQEALKIKVDGVIGQQTLKAAVAASGRGSACFLAHRALRYMKTTNFLRFGRGWIIRLFILALSVGGK